MWKFLEKLLSPKKAYPAAEAACETARIENNAEAAVLESQPDDLHDGGNYQYYCIDPSLSEFEKSLLRLRSYDGHIRQAVLEDM